MSRHNTPITFEVGAYIREVTVREPEPLRRLREATEDHPRASWWISPEQGQFLYLLATTTEARRAIEVGVLMGYSAAWIAQALPGDGKLVACELSGEYNGTARKLWRECGVEEKIDLRLGPALESLDAMLAAGEAGTYDFIFIDADKGGYIDYYERAVELVRPRGLIAADNALSGGAVADPANPDTDAAAIRAFNRRVREDTRVATSLATLGDGLMLACKL